MKTDETFNGYTNYETWLAALWLNNDEFLMDSINERTGQLLTASTLPGQLNTTTRELADFLRLTVETLVFGEDGFENGLATDLMRAAVERVNYRELAEGYLDSAPSIASEDEKEGARLQAKIDQ